MPGISFGFSWVGMFFLIMLFVPNLAWVKHKPQGYGQDEQAENRLLLTLERVGQVAVTCLVLISANLDPGREPGRGVTVWLAAAFVLMLLYEGFWLRYFKSEKTLRDFYSSFLGVPVAGATLPVAAALLLGIHGGSPLLLAAAAVLGVGHIGIHLQHWRQLEKR